MPKIMQCLSVIILLFLTSYGKSPDKAHAECIASGDYGAGKMASSLDASANFLYQDADCNRWFASREKGLYRFDGERLIRYTLQDGLLSTRIITVQEDRSGQLYFDTPEGVMKFDGSSFAVVPVDTASDSGGGWALHPDDLWFNSGWRRNGPLRYDGTRLYQLSFPKNERVDSFYSNYPNASFNPYGVYAIFRDSKGHMWFGTASLGLYHYDGHAIRWMYERHLTETPGGGDFGIRSIAEDHKGFMWICNTDYKYALKYDSLSAVGSDKLWYSRETGIVNKDQKSNYFLSMEVDRTGDIWLQTYDDGVWQNTGDTLIHYPIRTDGEDIILLSLAQDRDGVLWVGTENEGAYRFDGSEFVKFHLN